MLEALGQFAPCPLSVAQGFVKGRRKGSRARGGGGQE